jgi:hypothetical protein
MTSAGKVFSRLAALAFPLAVVALGWIFVFEPIRERSVRLDEDIRVEREVLGRLLSEIDQQAQRASMPARSAGEVVTFLTGGSETARIAELQSHLDHLAREAGLSIASSESVAGRRTDTLDLPGVQITLKGAIVEIQRFLHAIETADPTAVVESVDIVSSPTLQNEAANVLDVRLVVRAASDAKKG